ncbi:MAG: hypothetical protein JSR33_08855 [Proteobacteria bacterium]|nr:hypothetical protein [Pseudomonadota bacterium]
MPISPELLNRFEKNDFTLNAVNFLELGDYFFTEKGDYYKAVKCYKNALKVCYSSPNYSSFAIIGEAYRNLGLVYQGSITQYKKESDLYFEIAIDNFKKAIGQQSRIMPDHSYYPSNNAFYSNRISSIQESLKQELPGGYPLRVPNLRHYEYAVMSSEAYNDYIPLPKNRDIVSTLTKYYQGESFSPFGGVQQMTICSEFNKVLITPPDGWDVLITAAEFEGYRKSGYFGVAYVNYYDYSIVIAHRGTEKHQKEDLLTDFKLLLSEISEQVHDALNFTKKIKSHYPEYTLSHTGHSLGAALAEICAWFNNVAAVTFESPGTKSIIEQIQCEGGSEDSCDEINPDNDSITGYVLAPNIVNTMDKHVGKLTRVIYTKPVTQASDYFTCADLQPSILESLTLYISPFVRYFIKYAPIINSDENDRRRLVEYLKGIVGYSEEQHSMANMLSCFDFRWGEPERKHEMLLWPKGLDFLKFYSLVTKNNIIDYHPILEQLSKRDSLLLKQIQYQERAEAHNGEFLQLFLETLFFPSRKSNTVPGGVGATPLSADMYPFQDLDEEILPENVIHPTLLRASQTLDDSEPHFVRSLDVNREIQQTLNIDVCPVSIQETSSTQSIKATLEEKAETSYLEQMINASKALLAFPGQDVLMLLQIPFAALGRYRDRIRHLCEQEQLTLRGIKEKLDQYTKRIEPLVNVLYYYEPEFVVDSKQLVDKIKVELLPALESNKASGLVIERLTRYISYLEKRVMAAEDWRSHLPNNSLCSKAEEDDDMSIISSIQPESTKPNSWTNWVASGVSFWRNSTLKVRATVVNHSTTCPIKLNGK